MGVAPLILKFKLQKPLELKQTENQTVVCVAKAQNQHQNLFGSNFPFLLSISTIEIKILVTA